MIRFAIIILFWLVLVGCTNKIYFGQMDLLYPSEDADKLTSCNNCETIYIAKPNISNLLPTDNQINDDKKRLPNYEVVLYNYEKALDKRPDAYTEVINTKGTYIVGFDGSCYFSRNNPGEWISSALGYELNKFGYSVKFVDNLPLDAKYSIKLSINNILSNFGAAKTAFDVQFACRGYINFDATIIKDGTVISQLNYTHEADFPEYTKYSNIIQCIPNAQRYTLKQLLERVALDINKMVLK